MTVPVLLKWTVRDGDDEILPATQSGALLVSVSRNTDSLAKIEENPTLYRPEFMTITLPS